MTEPYSVYLGILSYYLTFAQISKLILYCSTLLTIKFIFAVFPILSLIFFVTSIGFDDLGICLASNLLWTKGKNAGINNKKRGTSKAAHLDCLYCLIITKCRSYAIKTLMVSIPVSYLRPYFGIARNVHTVCERVKLDGINSIVAAYKTLHFT